MNRISPEKSNGRRELTRAGGRLGTPADDELAISRTVPSPLSTTTSFATMSKVIILTGASKGLGLAALRIALASPLSAAVVAVSRSLPEELLALQREHTDRLELIAGDVSDRAVSVKAVAKAVERWGRLDAVILNGWSPLAACGLSFPKLMS